MMSETASDPHSPTTGVSVGTGTTLHPHAPRLRAPRTIPPWIDSYEVRYGEPTDAAMGSMYRPPPQAATPQHNNTPSEPHRRMSRDGYVYPDDLALTEAKRSRVTFQSILRKGGAERGRKWDHLRSAEPVIVSKFLTPETGPFWRSFVRSSAYGHLPNEEAQVVSVDELDKMQPGFNNPADVPRSNDLKRSRATRTAALYKRVWSGILEHPLVPLAFRLTVLVTSVIALALGIKILESEEGEADPDRGAEWTQAVVAIVVDSVAIPYIGYMTWDEYTGKPLGLRTATSKISLVLMDLFFIIFKSASTTLAFEALVYHNAYIPVVERYSRALAAFQTVGLISWTMTFTVNVFRLVQRLGGGEEDTHMWGGYSAHG